MIIVDTGPFVALFDPQDAEHTRCKDILSVLRDPLFTTIPVLTEAFHLLTPNSMGITQWIWQILLSLSLPESLRTTKVFTLDLADFKRYRIRRGHRHVKVDILG